MMLFSQGDSGGGATVLLEGRHVLIGITVGMNGNCTTNTPTKVRPIFIGFLEETCKIHYFPWPNTVRMFLPVLVLIRYFQSRRVFSFLILPDPFRRRQQSIRGNCARHPECPESELEAVTRRLALFGIFSWNLKHGMFCECVHFCLK